MTAFHPGSAVKPQRLSTLEDRRRIKAALDDAYGTNSYLPGKSDESIAAQLDVPRAWVSSMREEFYGPAVNEKLDEAVEEIKRSARKISEDRSALVALKAEIEEAINKASERLVIAHKTVAELNRQR